MKRRFTAGKENNLFFWRDNTGHEIDLVIADPDKKIPVEIKSSQTISSEFFKGIQFWNDISGNVGGYIIYGGTEKQKRSNDISVLPFREIRANAYFSFNFVELAKFIPTKLSP